MRHLDGAKEDMGRPVRAGLVELEADIKSAFEPFESDEFDDLIAGALAGEYFGYSTFAALAEDSVEHTEQLFWKAARDVEGVMIRNLEPLLDGRNILRPDKSMYVGIGERTAAIFADDVHRDYCVWVSPRIDSALDGLRKLQAISHPGPDRMVCDDLIAHEFTLMNAWAKLQDGFAAATAPLSAFLARH